MDTLESLGISALASRVRRLGDSCYEQVKRIYDSLSVEFEPSWYPYVMHVHSAGECGINDIAQSLGISQPAASAMVKKIVARKLFTSKPLPQDARTRVIALTEKGRQTVARIRPIVEALQAELESVDMSLPGGIMAHIGHFEQAFHETCLHSRAIRRLSNTFPFSCVLYEPKWHSFYETHNLAWVQKYFTVEPMDEAMLKDPETHVLGKGGHIYIVCLGDYPIGGFSFIPRGEHRYELSKMYVPFALQGFGFGRKLMELAMERAAILGAETLYLLSNRSLGPAIHLYRSFGFEEQPILPEDTHYYTRCNIRMERRITPALSLAS